MDDRRRAHAIGRIAAFEHADDASTTQRIGVLCHKAGQMRHIIQLQSEFTQRIARQRIEARGDEDEVRLKAHDRPFERALEMCDILFARQAARERDVPDIVMRPAIRGGTGARIPGPLVHRHEMDVGIILHQRLCPVAVVHVPIHDQDASRAVMATHVVRANRDVAEEAESHRAIVERVMSRRADRAKTSRVHSLPCEVDRIEHAAGRGRGGVPRAFAGNRVCIEPTTTRFGHRFDRCDVRGIVCQRHLVGRGVPPFSMLDQREQIDVISECARDGAQAADVLRMSPPRIVPPAVRVRNERD